MIRLVVAIGALAFAMGAPAWAQERRQKHELRQEQRLAERPELDVDEAPEAGENDADGAREVFTTDDLDEGLSETPEAEPGEELAEEEETIAAGEIPPDAGRPEASAFPGGPTFQEQMGRLVVDLRYDRASGREYARAPERGREAVVHDVSRAIREQLLANDCWEEEDAILPGRRETFAIAVRFDADGHFIEKPRLVSPPEMPDDLALRRLIDRTFGALRACNANGFKLPPQYFEDPIWVYFIMQSRPE